jgi:hypothetical protein
MTLESSNIHYRTLPNMEHGENFGAPPPSAGRARALGFRAFPGLNETNCRFVTFNLTVGRPASGGKGNRARKVRISHQPRRTAPLRQDIDIVGVIYKVYLKDLEEVTMKQIKITFIIFAISFLSACGKKEGGPSSANPDTPKNAASVATPKRPKNSPSIEGLFLGMDKIEYSKVVFRDWPKKQWMEGATGRNFSEEKEFLMDMDAHPYPYTTIVDWDFPEAGYGCRHGIDAVFKNDKLSILAIDELLVYRMHGLPRGEDREILVMKLNQTYGIDMKRVLKVTQNTARTGRMEPEDIFIDFNHGWELQLDTDKNISLSIRNGV